MSLSQIFTQKKVINKELKQSFWLFQKFKSVGFINLKNKELTKNLIEWLKNLPVAFIVKMKNIEETSKIGDNIIITKNVDEKLLDGFDFVVLSDNMDWINIYLEKAIAPIIIKDNHLGSVLSEFDPIKNEWNAFFYDSENQWSIFYSIARYLENYKFPFDNKNLIKNILEL